MTMVFPVRGLSKNIFDKRSKKAVIPKNKKSLSKMTATKPARRIEQQEATVIGSLPAVSRDRVIRTPRTANFPYLFLPVHFL
jgi:hypothetical protein